MVLLKLILARRHCAWLLTWSASSKNPCLSHAAVRLLQLFSVSWQTHFLIKVCHCFLFAGLNILWSGSTDEFDISNSAYGYLIPAFVKYLMSVQPPYPYPPNPEVKIFCKVSNWIVALSILCGINGISMLPYSSMILSVPLVCIRGHGMIFLMIGKRPGLKIMLEYFYFVMLVAQWHRVGRLHKN